MGRFKSRGGEWLGRLIIPDGLTVLEIGQDYILGLEEDTLGVERVQLLALERSGTTF